MLTRAALILLLAAPSFAADDPRRLLPPALPDFTAARLAAPACPDTAGPLALPALVDLALCRNPATAAGWAAVRTAAANAGQARASLLPTLNAAVTPGGQVSDSFGGGSNFGINPITGLPIGSGGAQTLATATATLSLQWLLFDFGGRRARIDAADANRAAALAVFADSAQAIVQQVAQGYYAVAGNAAALDAAAATLRFAQGSFEAARAREAAGVGLRSDTLQAETALAQARLTARQAEGNLAIAQGQLATAVGLPPTAAPPLAPPPPLAAPAAINERADALIAQAERLRPDLAQRRAALGAAQASLRAARADRAPSLSLGVSPQVNLNSRQQNSSAASIGLTLSLPLFNGFGRTYAVAGATSEVDRNAALLEQARQQAGLDVWTQYQSLRTSTETLGAARAAQASAAAAADLAQGRFRAGVGTITDLLNAQNALATARQQAIQAEYGVRTAEVALARAVGDVGEAVR